ncbi:MAG: 3-phosphoshikimate 1-carboxyvinyltransferase [Promethearchaeota archaeon]
MKIYPLKELKGIIRASPSKAYSHRAFFIAIGAISPSFIIDPLDIGDVAVSIKICQLMGGKIQILQGLPLLEFQDAHPEFSRSLRIYKINPIKKNSQLVENRISQIEFQARKFDAKNSGFSVRMLIAFSCLFSFNQSSLTIIGRFFEIHRPIIPLLTALSHDGTFLKYKIGNNMIEIIKGIDIARDFIISGEISSQFISVLCLLAPHLRFDENQKNSTISVINSIVSLPYLLTTEEVMRDFNIHFKIKSEDIKDEDVRNSVVREYFIPAEQSYKGRIYQIPGDFSSTAFLLVAAALNPLPERVVISNLDLKSAQGDKVIIQILQTMGANIIINSEEHYIELIGGQSLKGIEIECTHIPDLFPILCVLGLFSENQMILSNIQRIRLKESDRVAIMIRELSKMGAIIQENPDSILIEGPQQIHGADLDPENDHRIAMALTIGAIYARTPSSLLNFEVVNDSYPEFFSDLTKLGIKFS